VQESGTGLQVGSSRLSQLQTMVLTSALFLGPNDYFSLISEAVHNMKLYSHFYKIHS
jgi:hypothetical protein